MIGEQLKHIGEVGIHAFEGAVHSAAEFEYNISRIGAVLTTSGKATSQQMQQMSEDALKIGSSSSFSANEIAEGMYTLARQGLDAATILGDGVNGAINIVNDLAQATDSTMTDTATVITDVVHEYGLSGEQLRSVANTISGALHNSSESLDDFYQSMKQVGPVASAMHQNAMDMSTALALLAQHGITGSSAGTALKNMLLGLSPRTKAAAEDFAKLGISVQNGAANSFFDLQGNLRPLPDIINLLNEKFNGLSDAQKQAALSTVFTKYGLAGLNTIVTESRDKFLEFQNELRKDDAATIAAKKMDNLHGDLLKFNAGVTTMMKSFGDSINGMLRPIVQGATKAIKWLTDLPDPVKKAGMALLGIVSVIAVVTGGVLTFIAGLSLLAPGLEIAGVAATTLGGTLLGIGALLSEILIPIGLVIAAIAGLAYVWTHDLGGIQEKTKIVWDWITTQFMAGMKVVKETVGEGIKAVLQWWNQMEPTFSKAVHNIYEAIIWLKPLWEAMWESIKIVVSTTFNVIVKLIQDAWKVISGIYQFYGDLLAGNWSKLWDDLKQILTGAVKFLIDPSKIIYDKWIEVVKNLFQNLKSEFDNGIDQLKSKLNDWWNSIKQWFDDKKKEIVSQLEKWWDSVKQWVSEKTQEWKTRLEDWWKSIGAWFDSIPSRIQQKLNQWGKAIVQWTKQQSDENNRQFGEWGKEIENWFKSIPNLIQKQLETWKKAITDWFTKMPGEIQKNLEQWWKSVENWFTQKKNEWSKNLEQWWNAIQNWFTNKNSDWSKSLEGWWKNIQKWLSQKPGEWQKGLEDWWNSIKQWLDDAPGKIQKGLDDWWTTIKNWFSGVPDKPEVKNAGSKLVDKMKEGINDKKKDFTDNLGKYIVDACEAVGEFLAVAALAVVRELIKRLLSSLNSEWHQVSEGIGKAFAGLAGDAQKWGASLVDNIAKGISGAVGSITSAVSGIVSSAWSAISGAASSVGSALSSVIPHFANGGILDSPTYALVGEAGPEAIIPLSDPTRGLALWQQAGQMLGVLPSGSSIGGSMALSSGYSGGGVVYNITVHASGNITRNERELGDIVSRAIIQKTKMQGKL